MMVTLANQMGVSINGDTAKWMVYSGKPDYNELQEGRCQGRQP